MRKKLGILGIAACMMLTFCACVIRNPVKISQKTLDERKEAYEDYLANTYPGETFTVDIWQEYSTIGSAGMPAGYEGYIIMEVITDSKGNRFRIFHTSTGYMDDYQKVLDGQIEYNEKGQRAIHLSDGSVIYVDY